MHTTVVLFIYLRKGALVSPNQFRKIKINTPVRLEAEAAAEEYLRYNETNRCSRLCYTENLINYTVYNGDYFLFDMVCDGVI